MTQITLFDDSRIVCQGVSLLTGRRRGRDVIVARHAGGTPEGIRLRGAEKLGDDLIFPATYDNMLVWERELAPERRMIALNGSGHSQGFGAGNRIVLSGQDVPHLRDLTTFGGWDGIFAGMQRSAAPFWYVQQSIVRELIPEGVDQSDYPGIGHTGGYGPRELLRAGLFAFASQGGYTRYGLPIGADADHAIVTGRDEETLAASLALNKLALDESRDYTKFTVDTSHLFDYPVALSASDRKRLLDAFSGRHFRIPNILPGRAGFEFQYGEDEIVRLGTKYWRAAVVHKELYDHVSALKGGEPFDYELSLDETPEPTPPRDLLFYIVLLTDVLDLPVAVIASAGPNIGFTKRHDFEGSLGELWPQVNVSASILDFHGAMLSVHSADGVDAQTGKGAGVDEVLRDATGGRAELKVADVYQEVLWQVLEHSPDGAERELFRESWRLTYETVRLLANLYRGEFATSTLGEARRLLSSPNDCQRIAGTYGTEAPIVAQKTIGYGLPVFRLAVDLLSTTDPDRPSSQEELFRRFMFIPYRSLRQSVFQGMSHEGWQRLAGAVEEATMVRIRSMGWDLRDSGA